MRRGLFVTVLQSPPVLSSRERIDRLVDFAKAAHIKVIFIQIYYAGQAWFPSRIADQAPYKSCLNNLSEDPIRLLIKKAHGSHIQVHAWMNLLSLGNNKNALFIKKYGTDILTKNRKDKKRLEDYRIDDQYFLEPGDSDVRKDISGIVEEVLRAYPELDGVQFDYIRYPDKNPDYGYTKTNISRFKKATGLKTVQAHSQAWDDWKRTQVTEFLGLLAKKTRIIRPDITISTTGCMPYSRAYYEAFQDWPSWINHGTVDFVTIMDYSPNPSEFQQWIVQAKKKVNDFKKINISIGAYKLLSSPAAFKREVDVCEKIGIGGYAIFHYGSLLQNPVLGKALIKKDGVIDKKPVKL